MNFEFHEAANIFPMDDETLDELADDIRKHGQRIPIELLDGQIVDGRRRFMACRMAGVEPRTINVNPDDPVAYVLSLNLHRRHLTPSQKSMVAARAGELHKRLSEEAVARMKSGKKIDPSENFHKGRTSDHVAKIVGVSGRSVDFAAKVLRDGTPELIKAVDEGRMAVSTAAVYASDSPEIQREVATDPKRNRVYHPNQNGGPEPKDGPDEPADPPPGESRGKGVQYANEAINCLKRIPKNDALRKRGFQIVTDWIKHNR